VRGTLRAQSLRRVNATVDGTHFRANYKGGTGNDLTLIVVL